ncbi:hypothetical protein [Photobacterium sp. 1_MG-2023]|uniref:hypothetical protein n=1 Tax=Photobacterium sp. 1_MG-2023 TaxID=3062646 RepID=UPI0026E1A530|nr:hypothetical protein [Photobacterium sp. 1_MG-2023]MDO6707525.1 hypothetical protein [Photobacterium sp. 1_MG-2023]
MNYYLLECDFIEDEASFSFDNEFRKIVNKSDLSIKAYGHPPVIHVDQVYTQRNISDVLKTIDFIPHRKIVDFFNLNFISGVQFIPVEVNLDDHVLTDYFHMNVYTSYSVLEVHRSEARNYSDYYESYDFIKKMVFDSKKLNQLKIKHDVFRVKEYISAVVVNEKVKNILDKHHITGVVTFPIEVI